MLAAFRENKKANSSSSALSSRNSRAASSAVGVPLTHKLTSIAPLSSSYAGRSRVTVLSFISTHATIGNPVVPHASQPPISALSAPSLFDSPFTAIDQQPDLGAFSWESICSQPQLSANTGKMVTK